MKRSLPVLALVGACSGDPRGFCALDNAVDPGPGCSVPLATIAIDGDERDWEGIPIRDCPTCNAGDVAQIRASHTADGRVAFAFDTLGAPLVDANHSYVVSLGPLREPSYWIDIRLAPGVPPEFALNYVAFTGMPVEYAFGPGGIEVAFPVAALPHNGGVHVFCDVEVRQGTDWVPQQIAPAEGATCWDPKSPVCQPL